MKENIKRTVSEQIHPEVRITLKSILNMSNLAINSSHDEDHLLYIRKIQRTAASLLKTLDKTGGIGGETAIPVELEHTEFNLEQVFEDLRDQLAEQIETKGLEFVFQIAPTVPTYLFGDALRLSQVLLNLASNAVKFTEKGEVTIDVYLKEKSDTRAFLEFQVKDTGIGLTEEQQAALFEEPMDTFSVTQHHILGLGVVRQLVEKMGGSVSVKSEVNQGSTFGFTAAFDIAGESLFALVPPSPILNGMRALVVDDNTTMRKTLGLMLETLGLEVVDAASGAEAIEALEQTNNESPFELVFMDWMMPGMDGLEASRRIINHPSLSWKPVIVMVTAYGRNDLRLSAKKIGIEGFLLKPVSISTLQSTLLSLFRIEKSS